jgi:hypothetical protein
MGYIPADAEWYVAELVMEITVHGSASNVVHRNLVLIRANSPEEAFQKALHFGQGDETEYTNPKDQLVEIKFRGISKLDFVYEPIKDGAELCFEEQQGVSEDEIQNLIRPKEGLEAFTPPNPGKEREPDYRSKSVMEEAVRMIDKSSR